MSIANSNNTILAVAGQDYSAAAINYDKAQLNRWTQGIGAALGVGVCPFKSGSDYLGTPDLNGLKVTRSGTTLTIGTGRALFFDPATYDFQVGQVTTPLNLTYDSTRPYIYAQFTADTFATGECVGGQSAQDDLVARVVLLAAYDGTTLTDLRRFIGAADVRDLQFLGAWDGATQYNKNAVVIGGDGTWYYSRTNGNETHDPTTDATHWGIFGNVASGGGGGYTPDTAIVSTQTVTGTDVTSGTYSAFSGSASLAFDGDTATFYESEGTSGEFLTLDRGLGNEAAFNALKVTMPTSTGGSFALLGKRPTTLTIKGRNTLNPNSGVQLYTASGIAWGDSPKSWSWTNPTAYRYLDIYLSNPQISGAASLVVSEIRAFASATSGSESTTVSNFVGLLTPPLCTSASAPNGSDFVNSATGRREYKRQDGTVVDLDNAPVPPMEVTTNYAVTANRDSRLIVRSTVARTVTLPSDGAGYGCQFVIGSIGSTTTVNGAFYDNASGTPGMIASTTVMDGDVLAVLGVFLTDSGSASPPAGFMKDGAVYAGTGRYVYLKTSD